MQLHTRVLRLALAVLALGGPASGAAGQEAEGVDKLVVATRHVPPFAIKSADGTWSGIAISLVREIAADIRETSPTAQPVELEFRELSLKDMLAAVAEGEVDLVAGALTVNLEREGRMDFSHPFHTSGLGIAAADERRSGWRHVLNRVFSPAFLRLIVGIFALLLVSGLLVYAFERRSNPSQFGGGVARGLGAGMWWSIVTLTTVGYGDKAPQTAVGRGVAVLWMLRMVIENPIPVTKVRAEPIKSGGAV